MCQGLYSTSVFYSPTSQWHSVVNMLLWRDACLLLLLSTTWNLSFRHSRSKGDSCLPMSCLKEHRSIFPSPLAVSQPSLLKDPVVSTCWCFQRGDNKQIKWGLKSQWHLCYAWTMPHSSHCNLNHHLNVNQFCPISLRLNATIKPGQRVVAWTNKAWTERCFALRSVPKCWRCFLWNE